MISLDSPGTIHHDCFSMKTKECIMNMCVVGGPRIADPWESPHPTP